MIVRYMLRIGVLLALLSIAGGVYASILVKRHSDTYETNMRQLISYGTAESLAKFKMQGWAETLSFGMYASGMRQEVASLEAKEKAHKQAIEKTTISALGSLLAAAVVARLVSLRTFLFVGSLSAAVMLAYGLVLPMLRMTLHKPIPYLGDVVFSYTSKSLLGTAEKLFASHDWVVGGVIVLFSVIVPWLKLLAIFSTALLLNRPFAYRVIAAFKHLGKWSMLDVFVVATLLVFLSMKESEFSRATIGEGVYFFLGYVLVSMCLSVAAEKLLKRLSNYEDGSQALRPANHPS